MTSSFSGITYFSSLGAKGTGVSFAQTNWWQSAWRKLHAFRTVSQKKTEGPLTQADLLWRIAAIMGFAVHFNDHPGLMAVKVCHIRTRWMLSAKFQAISLIA